jgi:hypothetical protein
MKGESDETERRSIALDGCFDTIERHVAAKARVDVFAHLSGNKCFGRIGRLFKWLEDGVMPCDFKADFKIRFFAVGQNYAARGVATSGVAGYGGVVFERGCIGCVPILAIGSGKGLGFVLDASRHGVLMTTTDDRTEICFSLSSFY